MAISSWLRVPDVILDQILSWTAGDMGVFQTSKVLREHAYRSEFEKCKAYALRQFGFPMLAVDEPWRGEETIRQVNQCKQNMAHWLADRMNSNRHSWDGLDQRLVFQHLRVDSLCRLQKAAQEEVDLNLERTFTRLFTSRESVQVDPRGFPLPEGANAIRAWLRIEEHCLQVGLHAIPWACTDLYPHRPPVELLQLTSFFSMESWVWMGVLRRALNYDDGAFFSAVFHCRSLCQRLTADQWVSMISQAAERSSRVFRQIVRMDQNLPEELFLPSYPNRLLKSIFQAPPLLARQFLTRWPVSAFGLLNRGCFDAAAPRQAEEWGEPERILHRLPGTVIRALFMHACKGDWYYGDIKTIDNQRIIHTLLRGNRAHEIDARVLSKGLFWVTGGDTLLRGAVLVTACYWSIQAGRNLAASSVWQNTLKLGAAVAIGKAAVTVDSWKLHFLWVQIKDSVRDLRSNRAKFLSERKAQLNMVWIVGSSLVKKLFRCGR